MDEKRTQTLCSGLLAKAPLKNKRKASLPVFWKLRWCVLSRVTYLDSPSKDTKLVFAYYKDEAHLREDSLPLGKIEINKNTGIRSVYKSQAGFDHLFSIECPGNFYAKFSAPSCKLKSQWIAGVYYHLSTIHTNDISNSKLPTIGRKFSQDSGIQTRTSSQGNDDSWSFARTRNYSDPKLKIEVNKEDSAHEKENLSFLRSRSTSLLNFIERGIPLFVEDSSKYDGKILPQNDGESAIKNEEKELQWRLIYSSIFMLCENCEQNASKCSNRQVKRTGSRKKQESLRLHKDREIETKISLNERRESVASASTKSLSLSDDSGLQDELSTSRSSVFSCDDDYDYQRYSYIDEKLFEKVQEANCRMDGNSERLREEIPHVNKDVDDNNDDADNDASDSDVDSLGIYVDMHDNDDDDDDGAINADGYGIYVDMYSNQMQSKDLMAGDLKNVLFEMNL